MFILTEEQYIYSNTHSIERLNKPGLPSKYNWFALTAIQSLKIACRVIYKHTHIYRIILTR